MNEENLKLFGFWWVRKRKRMQSKYDEACADLKACAVDLNILRAEWIQQVQDVSKKAPSEFLQWLHMLQSLYPLR